MPTRYTPRMSQIPRLVVIAVALAALAACGNKGPLVLPTPPAEEPVITEPATTEPATTEPVEPAVEPADAEASDTATPPTEPPADPPVPETDGNG